MVWNRSAYEEVYRANGRTFAELIRSFLEASGIPVLLSYESVSSAYSLNVGPLGEVRVYVPREHAEEARALLEAMDQNTIPPVSDDLFGNGHENPPEEL